MSGSFKEDDTLLEGEWVEICDIQGRKTTLRHLATVSVTGKTYLVLGAAQDDSEEPSALMLVRKDSTVDGAEEYTIASDEREVERVVGHFVMHVLKSHLSSDMLSDLDDAYFDDGLCGCRHLPGEFCFCGDPEYLQ